jgi:hypothetical protein
MKPKLVILVCKIIVCQWCVLQATAELANESPAATHQLSDALHDAIMSHEKNVDCTDVFESIISNSTNAMEQATARVYLASGLFHGITAENAEKSVQRIYQACENMPNTPSTQWQAAAAKVIVVATKALEGKRQESITLSRAALEAMDFETIEHEESIAWKILKKDFQGGKHVLRETLKANIANELSNSGRSTEAEEVWRTMSDGVFRHQMAERIVDEYASQADAILKKQRNAGQGDQAIDHAKALFDRKVEELGRSGDWNSLSLQGVLKVVSKQATNAVVAATAKVYLARCLLAGLASIHSDDQRKMHLRRIHRLGNEVSAMPAESWQSGLMAWIVASAKHLEGENEEAVAIASSALKSVDFESLEKNGDQAWLVIGKTMGERPFILRESLNSLLEQSRMEADP